MTEWQWKVVMALVRYVLSQKCDWIEFDETHENALHDAIYRESKDR